jgi:DNA-binding Lrp family transcriptional regulator
MKIYMLIIFVPKKDNEKDEKDGELFSNQCMKENIMIKAYILLNMNYRNLKKALDKMSSFKQIEKISVIAGQFDVIVRVAIENLEELLELTNKIQMINGVEKTTTQIIEKEIIL